MSRRQTRPPGSTVRRDTVRNRIAEKDWSSATKAVSANVDAFMDREAKRFPPASPRLVEKLKKAVTVAAQTSLHSIGAEAVADMRTNGAPRCAGIAADLSRLAGLYDDPLLRRAAERLQDYGLGGDDWREVERADRGILDDPLAALAALEVVTLLAKGGVKPIEAYEQVATRLAISALSHKGALQFVKRAHLQYLEAATAEERIPALRKRRARKGDPTG